LAIGVNNYDRVVYKIKYGKYKVFGSKSYKPCFHSEISAILKLGKEDCSDIEFFNIRIDNNGNIVSSKPCANCMNMLRTMGFKRIYYTNS
jgi:deoxycytidylate deaminase